MFFVMSDVRYNKWNGQNIKVQTICEVGKDYVTTIYKTLKKKGGGMIFLKKKFWSSIWWKNCSECSFPQYLKVLNFEKNNLIDNVENFPPKILILTEKYHTPLKQS